MSQYPSSGDGRLTPRDLWEILRLPVFAALVAIVATWLVWYFTSASCSPELAQTTGCNPSQVARYVNLEIVNKAFTHAAVAAGGGGIWSYAVITRERRAREAAEMQLAEVLAQAAEERAQSSAQLARVTEQMEQLMAQAAEERAQAAEERAQAAAERAQAAAERAQASERIAQLQEQAAEERSQYLALLAQLTERLEGNGQSASH